MEAFFHFLLMLVFLVLYILAYIIVKPTLMNHKRPASTLSLKVSYLIYLAALLICVYLFMFYGPSDIENQLSEGFFFGLLISLFIPNLAILLRRNVHKNRVAYNIIFSIINLLITFFLIVKLNQHDWFVF
ncbi:MAG TPA: hypothetical protein P5132_05925 [Bacteroidales bacterium]|nr:hypothetical protein [Bacteroidales bacterium]